jgi:glycosyltransferase involved in cell wall biosynthesis
MADRDRELMTFSHSFRWIERSRGAVKFYLVTAVGEGKRASGGKLSEMIESEASLKDITELNHLLFEISNIADALVLFLPKLQDIREECIHLLIDAIDEDPLFGFSMPRVVGQEGAAVTKCMAIHLPPTERRVVEGAPLLVRASVLRDFGLLDLGSSSLDAALVQLFMRANRRGMSARLVNSVVLEVVDTPIEAQDLNLINASDFTKAKAAQAALPEVRFERLLRHRFMKKSKRDLLVDIRNLAPGFNGTAHHILSLLGPLRRLAAERDIRSYIWVLPDAADFHGLNALYGDDVIYHLGQDQCFDASIRLSQPWSMTEVRDQAYVSAVNVFTVLDTIAWDCHYLRMPHIEGVWRAMAEYSDGFAFISNFSSHRFFTRFPKAQESLHVAAKCSMDPREYWSKDVLDLKAGVTACDDNSYILIVGNRYYHKGLAEVVPILSAAFPTRQFKVLGECSGRFHNVEQIPSGGQSEVDMAALFSGCACLVFSSFYEGFGLPIFEALAFGKPVLARHSGLIEELRTHLMPIAGLESFTSTNEMLRGLKRLLEKGGDGCISEVVLPPEQPYRWEDSALDILNLLETLLVKQDFSRCKERLEFFYRLELFDVERAGWTDASQNAVSFEVEKLE